jgi:hypothetical protein
MNVKAYLTLAPFTVVRQVEQAEVSGTGRTLKIFAPDLRA